MDFLRQDNVLLLEPLGDSVDEALALEPDSGEETGLVSVVRLVKLREGKERGQHGWRDLLTHR